MSEELTISVPVVLAGEAKAVLADGGLVDASSDTIDIVTTPANMPSEITVDITNMKPGDVIRLGAITLPKGTRALGDPDWQLSPQSLDPRPRSPLPPPPLPKALPRLLVTTSPSPEIVRGPLRPLWKRIDPIGFRRVNF